MSLRERLKVLGAAGERKRREEAARMRKEQGLKEERRRMVEKLKRVARDSFSPALKSVNEVFLGGRGSVSVGSYSINRPIPLASVRIDWDRYYHPGSEGGKRIEIALSPDLEAELGGAGYSPTIEFSLKDEDWEQKLEDGIITILGLGDSAYGWERHVGDWSVS